ncbi:ABC transporter permease [Dyadobacter beijingensis]|uniref:ABC transporter permease n=1 Tax=Dyadobacter beijingensis TaxID=365489 RepID=A0ABQ2I9W0_9BACT|nr:ABC transporter permease [Dyadobacter beijingensis]GGN04807.1 ABC transporter permease [Dyadobacter beijingensis]
MENRPQPSPPRWIDRLLTAIIAPHFLEDILGDLHEVYARQIKSGPARQARLRYLLAAARYVRPYFMKRKPGSYSPTYIFSPAMIKNYLKISLRTLAKQKAYSFINITGLALGMAVAMLIGLWIYDELSFDRSFQNFNRIAQVWQHQTFNGQVGTQTSLPFPIGDEIRRNYGADFKHVVMASWNNKHILAAGDKKFNKAGSFFEPDAPDMLSLRMISGTRAGLKDPYSILLSESLAKAYFGDADALDRTIKVDNKLNVKVTGVYEDLPHNTSFRDVSFMLPWQLMVIANPWLKTMDDPWRPNAYMTYVQLIDHADIDQATARIKDIKKRNINKEQLKYKPDVFLNPMRDWYLHSEFKEGHRVGGRIEFVWLFGTIGLFVLLLACINFMNLSTARSEKRAKEVGIRKAVGSVRNQLITQFFTESFLVVGFSFALSIALVVLFLPFFNEVADKKIAMPWAEPVFWLAGIGFSAITAIIAGSYPALYLSSFQPVKVLKGTFRAGRFAAVPRKVLVVVQFAVSIILIIGTAVVFRQIQFAKNRPVGYTRDGLITIFTSTEDIHKHFEAVRHDLKANGAIAEMAESGSPTTETWSSTSGFEWKGKDPEQSVDFWFDEVSYEYGKTVGWQFTQGRDFSREFATDSVALVVNETAVKFMGLQNPVDEPMTWFKKPYKIIGVIKDIVVNSPYAPHRPQFFCLSAGQGNVINIRLNPTSGSAASVAKIKETFEKYDPGSPFEYEFVDERYAQKFLDEVRIGKLTTFFSVLAILISCLGLFGVASFIAEQRTKEIGVRKVLGATVLSVWGLLSRDFVLLVGIAFLIATPGAYYFLNGWLQKYDYHTTISWWIFALTGLGTLTITLLTVSFQAIKAATTNPIRSLRSE